MDYDMKELTEIAEAQAKHIKELEAELRESRLSELAALGQAEEAYEKQKELEAENARLRNLCADAQAGKAVSSATDECLLRELIRRNGLCSAPTSRAPVPPIEVLVGIGKDHHCFIALHREAHAALEEMNDE